jgi:hypothetical protein
MNCVIENLIYLQYQIGQLIPTSPGQPSNPDPVTCAQLSGLLNATNAWLYQISISIQNASTGAPVDLSAVISALLQIGVAAQSYPPVWNAIATQLSGALGNIATAIASSGGTDLTALVAVLQQIYRTIDIPPSTVQVLVDAGYLSPDAMTTVGQGDFGDTLITTLVNFGYKIVRNFLETFGFEIVGGAPSFVGFKKSWSDGMSQTFADSLNARDTFITPVVSALVRSISADLQPAGSTSIGVIGTNPDKAVADALGIAFAAGAAAYLLAFIGIDEGEPLAHLAELVGGAVGFEELRDVQIGPLIREGIGRVAEFQARAKFQQELPGTAAMTGWVAQGLMDPARAQALSLFNGTPDEMFPIISRASFRGLNARQMLRLIETNLFSDAEIADELTFSAMRPTSQARMLRAAPYLATAPQRSSLIAAIEAAAVAGLLSDADLTSRVDAAETNDDRDSLILARVHLQQLVQESKDLETEYTTLFVGGIGDDATYRANLAAIGLQPWKVNTVAAKAEARSNATIRRKELAAAAAVARKTAGEEQQAAIKNFMAGNIDAAALATALIATGLTATQAAAMTDLAVLRLAGSQRFVYGLQLPAPQAALLRQRVAALTDQRKRLQIDDPTYVAQLRALRIGDRYVNALQAAADALISPKTAAFPIPVKTN